MKLGFTGTKNGMTLQQDMILRRLLRSVSVEDVDEFHHGDCVGADAEAHLIAVALGFEPVLHPPTENKWRAFMRAARVEPPYPYLKRNEHIVEATDMLIATPPGPEANYRRSGTWATVRKARKLKRPVMIIFPDGKVKEEFSII